MNYSIHSLIKASVLKACVSDPFVNSAGTHTYRVLSKFLVDTIASNPHGHTLRHMLFTDEPEAERSNKLPSVWMGAELTSKGQSWLARRRAGIHTQASAWAERPPTDLPAPLPHISWLGQETALWSWVGTLHPYEVRNKDRDYRIHSINVKNKFADIMNMGMVF